MKPKPFEIIVEFIPQSTKTDITYEAHQKGSLIRCKDCIHHHGYICDRLYGLQDAFALQDDDFCSRAEPKDTTEEVRKQLKDMEQRREMDRKK